MWTNRKHLQIYNSILKLTIIGLLHPERRYDRALCENAYLATPQVFLMSAAP